MADSKDVRSARLLAVARDTEADALVRVRAVRELMLDVLPDLAREILKAAREDYTWAEIADAGKWGSADSARSFSKPLSEEGRAAARERSAEQRGESIAATLPGISVAEAAERLGVTRQAVYLRIDKGELDARRVKRGAREWVRVVTEIPPQR